MKAVLFDLDGTLVQPERLKARSYAIATQCLQGLAEPDERAVEAYREIVGSECNVASRHIMESRGVEPLWRPLMAEHGDTEPEAVLTRVRLGIYDAMVADPLAVRVAAQGGPPRAPRARHRAAPGRHRKP